MEDLIRRSDAIEAIKDNSFALGDDYLEINGYGAIDDIRALPSADRPRGEWNFIGNNMFECTQCARAFTMSQFRAMKCFDTDPLYPNFCPSCGARMKGADDE